MRNITLETVGPGNLPDCGIGCLANQKHIGYQAKVEWLEKRFDEGLRFLLYRNDSGKSLAFLEYVPGEYAWRPVNAEGWLFVHCLWVYPSGQKVGGLGKRLIQACIEKAREANFTGVAAMVSDGPWMAGKRIFFNSGFQQVAESDRFQLVTHRLKDGPEPSFRNISSEMEKYSGLNLVYSDQCPMLPKSAADIAEMAAENGLELKVKRLNSSKEAQDAPSQYGVYNLLWNGRLLADHYVSKGRFKNILRKDILR